MTVLIEAIYEDGVLKPLQPIPIREHEKVQITIHSPARAEYSYGIMGYTGDAETAERLALDEEFGISEAP